MIVTGEKKRSARYDICIIGSGPAGLTIANELRDTGLKICVLESGQTKQSVYADKLRVLESSGIVIKENSRERRLGGASTVWSGLSAPLDAIDFESRPFLQVPGWSISRAMLDEYYVRAAEGYGFPHPRQLTADHLSPARKKGDRQLEWQRLDEKIFLASEPVRNFGTDLRHIFESETCDLITDATVVSLQRTPGSARVAHAVIRSSDGSQWQLAAQRFVVATGGIENARLLLRSHLGNEFGQVGKYFMNHPKHYYGIITLNKPVKELPYYFGHTKDGFAGYAGLRLHDAVQKEKGVLNSYVRFEPLYPWSDSEGIEAFVTLIKSAKPIIRAWLRSKKTSVVPLRNYAETGERSQVRRDVTSMFGLLSRVIANIIPVSRYVFSRLFEKGSPRIKKIRLRNFMEMEPRAENCVTLSDATDAYGEPIAHVQHECSELDRKSLIELHATLAREINSLGFGRLESHLAQESRWPIDSDASHHMGTTRMGEDPATSVVDINCKIHGVGNVYVAGSSVFSTSGCANPTFTIVALAIRLADQLKRVSSVGESQEPTKDHALSAME